MNLRRPQMGLWVLACAGLWIGAGCQPAGEEGDVLSAVSPGESAGTTGEDSSGRVASALRKACTMPVNGLVITEFMADPNGNPPNSVPDNYGEWIEVYNPTGAPIDMQGLWLKDNGTNSHQVVSSVVVPSLGYAVLCRESNPSLNGGVTCNYQYSNFSLVNTGGDAIRLCQDSACNTLIDEVVFTGTVPTGYSIELRHPYLPHATLAIPSSPNNPASWSALNFGISSTPLPGGDKGTPGARNSVWQEVEDPTCDDGNACTWDLCEKSECRNAWKAGCCLVDGDCNDSLPCTRDTCDLGTHTCSHEAIPDCCTTAADCIDTNPCNADYCSFNKCVHSSYNIVPGCCYSASGNQAEADAQCDDKNICTANHCDQGTNRCYYDPPRPDCCITGDECDDGDPCTYDQCWNNTCYNPKISPTCCRTDANCNDDNPCTDDRCVINSCRFFWNSSQCCYDNAWCQTYADDGNACTDERCVLDAGTGRYECQHPYKPNCSIDLPYVQPFEGASDFDGIGWKIVDYGTAARDHWSIDSGTTGGLGPDNYVRFTWTPTTMLVQSVLHSPGLNATISQNDGYNFYKKTTLQWRMIYKHSQPSAYVTLKVVGTTTSDFQGGTVLWQARTNEDIPYTLYSVELPDNLKFSPTLKIGFMVDTEDGSTFRMDSLQIDDVKVAAGRTNQYVKSMVYRCPTDGRPCTQLAGTLVAQAVAPDPIPMLTASVCDWHRIYLCMWDPDARYFTWNYFGFPGSFLDGDPMDHPSFIFSAPDVGQANGCESNPNFVQAVCGVPALAVPGYFFCGIDVKPQCADTAAGAWKSALVVKDEYDPTLPLHSPFETQVKFDTFLLLADGYLVWAPQGRNDPAAIAIRDAIQANGRKAQIVPDLSMVPDLTPFDGVIGVLGIYGNNHPVSASEAARLAAYLEGGGRVYLEGGEYFWAQKNDPVLEPYFRITATADGVAKQDGPLAGRNFLDGYDFGLSQAAALNAWNDRLVHTPEAGGREILRNAGTSTFASMVSFEGVSGQGHVYRTIGSSVLFAALQQQPGGATTDQLMGRLLDFLENGYPGCSRVAQCQDDEVCTDDSCTAGQCVNAPRPGCIACQDDQFRPDGSLACPLNQACRVDLGYCVDIPFENRFDFEDGTCGKFFGSGPTSAFCTINVTKPASLDDLHVKVKVNHLYRGDVRLRLLGPGGDEVLLKQENPADAKRNVYFTYDAGVPAAGDLNAFNGKHMEGTWTLVAEDLDPAIYNGMLEGFHLYATHSPLGCLDDSECPTDPCATVSCYDEDGNGSKECVYAEMDCDDGKDCTIDYCDPNTQQCVHEPISGSGCACIRHDECPTDEACLNQAETATCDPVGDRDPVTGEILCQCTPVVGTPYRLTAGLPAAIPDNDASGLQKSLVLSAPGYVNSLKVRLRTDHTAVGDLRAKLCHLGVCVTLRNLRGGAVAGFHDVYDFDPVDGPGALSDFRRLAVAGTWTLTVSDHIAGDTGSLLGMVIYMQAADCFQAADCNDGNPCTTDTCQNPSTGGTCEHTTVTCAPTTDPCRANVCNPANGQCELVNQPNGTACEDGLFCTEDDTCQAGTCTAGPPKSCSFLDGTCVVGVCNEGLRQCVRQTAPDGAACDDGEVCTGGDQCQAGVCRPGTQPLCSCPGGGDAECLDDGNKCNGTQWRCNAQKLCELVDGPVICPPTGVQCTKKVCDPFDGVCRTQTELNYMPCEDGAFCTVGDYCLTGMCQPGTARDCSALDEQCKSGVCNEATDACEAQNKANGTICEKDGAGCTIDQCTDGACNFKENVNCSAVADDCNDGVCQNVGWGGHVCVKGPLPDGTVCTDEPNPCTDDKCAGGLCVHTLLQNCNGPCGGEHAFDAGDDDCGLEDSCQNGIQGYPNGSCVPTCIAPNCVQAASGPVELPIDERLGCTVSALTLSTAYAYVEGVEAKVRLDHGYLADLTIDVIDPQGYAHRVWNHIGGANQGFANTFDLSFPVPYPGLPTSGVPMCSLKGESASGTWYLRVCDNGAGNGGVLHDWKLYVRGSDSTTLNQGHRCEDAIDLGSHPVVPTVTVDGTTECSLNAISDSGCGGQLGPDRTYMFTLTAPRRVTIRLLQPDRDLILVLKQAAGGTCAPGALECQQLYGAGSNPEVIDRQLQPGVYYVTVDTAGGPYDYGTFRFEIRIKDLLPNGADCVGDLGPQDLDCLSLHCQNGYCCDAGDCCPGSAWPVPPDGENPYLIRSNPDWISADTVCPAQYKEAASCNPSVGGINECQGQRYDANCVNFTCVKTRVDDDTACDESVQADPCGLYIAEYCGDTGPYVPGAQVKPACLTSCGQDADCDPQAHCDPAVATDPDQTVPPFTMTCQLDRVNGSTCNENSDCVSNHCQNGFCCDSGDCCPTNDVAGALTCPSSWYTTPWCSDATSCEGYRKDPVCSNNQCGQVLVRDDCACSGNLSDNCGFFIPVYCGMPPSGTCPATPVGGGTFEAGDPQCLTSCLVAGVENDSLCDDIARCDPCDQDAVDRGLCTPAQKGVDSVCIGNAPNGYPCDEASDCANKLYLPGGGHCQNGFCCDYGDCCAQASDCPAGYSNPPACDDTQTCQGHRVDPVCSGTFVCGTTNVDDDRGCVYDLNNPANECGYYLPIFCNGQQDQTPPQCPTTCLVGGVEEDSLCDANAHCDPDRNLPNQINSICQADLPNNEFCDEPSDCVSSYCQIHFCCDAGGCCNGCRVDTAVLNFASAGHDSKNGGYFLPDGTAVLNSVGQPSTVGRTGGTNRIVDTGFLAGSTVPVYCHDSVRNVDETDVDCGGPTCKKCAAGKECRNNSDCLSNSCVVQGVTSRCQ